MSTTIDVNSSNEGLLCRLFVNLFSHALDNTEVKNKIMVLLNNASHSKQMEQQITSLEKKLSEMSGENERTKVELDSVKSENEKLLTEIKTKETSITDQKNTNEALNTELSQLKEEKQQVDNELTKCQQQINEVKGNLQKAEDEKKELTTQINKLRQDLNNKEQIIKDERTQRELKDRTIQKQDTELKNLSTIQGNLDKWQDFEQSYMLYDHLPEEVKEGLKETLHGQTVQQWICSSLQEGAISSIWDYMEHLSKERGEGLDSLKKIFELLLKYWNNIDEHTHYELIIPNSGVDDFDEDTMIRTSESATRGIVKDVRLFGYTKNSDIIKKSLVLVK